MMHVATYVTISAQSGQPVPTCTHNVISTAKSTGGVSPSPITKKSSQSGRPIPEFYPSGGAGSEGEQSCQPEQRPRSQNLWRFA